MNTTQSIEASRHAPSWNAGLHTVGVFLVPAGQPLSTDQIQEACEKMRAGQHPWMLIGGVSSDIRALSGAGSIGALPGEELLAGRDQINETARVWASEWCTLSSTQHLFHVAGCNIGSSLHRELVYCFLAVLKRAFVLMTRWTNGTLGPVLALGEEGWESIEEENLRTVMPYWVGRSCGLRRVVIEEEKRGARQDWKRRAAAARKFFRLGMGPRNSKVLISSNPGIAGPVMEQLRSLAHRMMVLRPLLPLKPWWELGKKGIDVRVYKDYLTGRVRAGVAQEHKKLMASAGAWARSVRDAGVFVWHGVDWWEAVRPQFEYYFAEYFPTLMGYALFSRDMLRKERVTGILVDEDVCEFNRTLVTVAHSMGIPSVVLQHGAPFELQPTGLSPVSATKIAAWGRYSQDLLRRWGVPEEKIFLSGVPRYDGFAQETLGEAQKKVRDATGWDPKDPLLVLACDPYHREGREDFVGIGSSREEEEANVRCFLDGLASLPHAFGVVKLHPKDQDPAWVREIVCAHPAAGRVKVLQHFSTQTLLVACEALVTTHSTVAIEAMLAGKPVVTICLVGQDLQPHAQLGAAIAVRDAREIGPVLDRVLHDMLLRERLADCAGRALDYYMRRDGEASNAVARLLHKLIVSRR